MPHRDDFAEGIKRTLADRAAHKCSNPDCKAPTSGPQVEERKALNLGVAAHISAAAPGGPRYDPLLSPESRAGIANAIWLCQNCAKLIDNDPARFTAPLLTAWKQLAEARALSEIGKAHTGLVPAVAGVSDLWVSLDYIQKTGVDRELTALGYKLRWVKASRAAEFVDSDNWEEVIYTRKSGETVRFKVRDSSVEYLILLKKRESPPMPTAPDPLGEILAALPSEHSAVLAQLCATASELPSLDDVTETLMRIGAIEQLTALSRTRALYRLHPANQAQVRAFIAEKRESAYRACLQSVGEHQREFLDLYSQPKLSDEVEHPFIPAEVYNSLHPLYKAGVLIRGGYEGDKRYCERVSIAPDALTLIETLLKKPLQRRHIDLDLSQVGSAVDRGSGFRSSY